MRLRVDRAPRLVRKDIARLGAVAHDQLVLALARRAQSKTASPDGGAFFVAGTVEPTGVELSQGTFDPAPLDARPLAAALAELLRGLRVTTSGAALREDPPFAVVTRPRRSRAGASSSPTRPRGPASRWRTGRCASTNARRCPWPARSRPA